MTCQNRVQGVVNRQHPARGRVGLMKLLLAVILIVAVLLSIGAIAYQPNAGLDYPDTCLAGPIGCTPAPGEWKGP